MLLVLIVFFFPLPLSITDPVLPFTRTARALYQMELSIFSGHCIAISYPAPSPNRLYPGIAPLAFTFHPLTLISSSRLHSSHSWPHDSAHLCCLTTCLSINSSTLRLKFHGNESLSDGSAHFRSYCFSSFCTFSHPSPPLPFTTHSWR